MKGYMGILVGLSLFMGYADKTIGGDSMKTLHITWQRLVDDRGETCDRCGSTEAAVGEATRKLQRSFKEFGIDVCLEKKELSSSAFQKEPLESNRIWVAGKPLEKWLAATSGQSRCCSSCGDSDCRTLTVDGKTYEAVPAELIIRAGLLAGAELLHSSPTESCCPSTKSPEGKPVCCPSSSVPHSECK